MPSSRLTLFPLALLLALAAPAAAQDDPAGAVTGVSSAEFDQAIYKGIVGKVLDAIPMDPLKRLNLQRANAIVSNTASGRSLAVLAGLSNPVLLIAGLVWGVWSASNIKPGEADLKPVADSSPSAGGAASGVRLVALATASTAAAGAPAASGYEPLLADSSPAADANEAALSHLRVVKIWLPQRSSVLPH